MLIPFPSPISNRYKRSHKHVVAHHHLMLAGIDQALFLNQWGEPETQVGLNPLGSMHKLGSLFLVVDPTDEVHHSIWIYKKREGEGGSDHCLLSFLSFTCPIAFH